LKAAGGSQIGFSQETFDSEMNTADNNRAIVHMLASKKILPLDPKDSEKVLDFYTRCCACEVLV